MSDIWPLADTVVSHWGISSARRTTGRRTRHAWCTRLMPHPTQTPSSATRGRGHGDNDNDDQNYYKIIMVAARGKTVRFRRSGRIWRRRRKLKKSLQGRTVLIHALSLSRWLPLSLALSLYFSLLLPHYPNAWPWLAATRGWNSLNIYLYLQMLVGRRR